MATANCVTFFLQPRGAIQPYTLVSDSERDKNKLALLSAGVMFLLQMCENIDE